MPMSPEKQRAWRNAHPNYLKEYRRKNPEKFRAYALNRDRSKVLAREKLNQAVRSGKLSRPSNCERCGATVKVEGHHPDYSKPLEVLWLCHDCHYVTYHPERLLVGA